MFIDERLVIEAMCAMWAAGDLDGLVRSHTRDVVFSVFGSASSNSFLTNGNGRKLMRRRLGKLLSEFEVVRFQPVQIVRDDAAWLRCGVRYHYVHRATGMDIDGTMRHNCRMRDGRIERLEIVHDMARMSAFFDMVRRMTAEA
jgi:ketosteroid isomerase-like protein